MSPLKSVFVINNIKTLWTYYTDCAKSCSNIQPADGSQQICLHYYAHGIYSFDLAHMMLYINKEIYIFIYAYMKMFNWLYL